MFIDSDYFADGGVVVGSRRTRVASFACGTTPVTPKATTA
jgi:hypothetical protein